MQPDELTLAYLAGVIDSDGFISIVRSTHKGRVYHGARIGIAGTRREPHDLAASLWGGTVRRHVPKDPRHRPQFQWARDGAAAAEAITAVRPYLRIKARNAELALELHEHVLCGRSEDPFPWFGPGYDPIPHRDEMRAEIVHTLNQWRRIVAA